MRRKCSRDGADLVASRCEWTELVLTPTKEDQRTKEGKLWRGLILPPEATEKGGDERGTRWEGAQTELGR